MADAVGTAYVAVTADMSGFSDAVASAGADMASTLGSAGQDAGDAATSGMSQGMSTFGATLGGVLGANVALKAADSLTGFFTGAADKAKGAELANLRYETSLRNVAGASDEQIKSTSAYLSALGSTTATSGTQLKEAYAQILRGTKDVEQAQTATTLATDISAATGRDLSSVSMALSRAYMGNTTALGRMGVETKNADGSAKSLDQMLGDLQKTFGGTAEKAAGTAAGGMKKAELQFGAVQKSIGTALLPTIVSLADTLTTYVMPVLKVFAEIFGSIMSALGPIVPAIAAVVVGIKLWSIAQAVLNAVMDANPIMLVVIAIAALVAGVIWAYQNVEWFRAAVDTMASAVVDSFNLVLGIVQSVFGWIVDNWPLLLAILTGPFGLAVLFVTNNWNTIVDIVSGVFTWITDHWQLLLAIFLGPFVGAVAYVVSNWDTITDKVRGVVDAVTGFFAGLGDTLLAPLRAVVDWVTRTFGELPAKITGAFGNARDLLFNVGQDIVGGLIDGIKSMVGAAVDAVKHVGGSIVDGAKGILHIGSPSQVFMDIGRDVQLGLAQGIEGNAGLAVAAVDSSLGALASGNVAASTGGSTIDARLINNGTIYGVDDLDRWADQRDAKLVAALAVGTR